MNKPITICGFKFENITEACKMFDLNYDALVQKKSRAKKAGKNYFTIKKTIKVEW